MKTGTAVRMSAAVACGAENVSTVPGYPIWGRRWKPRNVKAARAPNQQPLPVNDPAAVAPAARCSARSRLSGSRPAPTVAGSVRRRPAMPTGAHPAATHADRCGRRL